MVRIEAAGGRVIKVPDVATDEVREDYERIILMEQELLSHFGQEKFDELIEGGLWALIKDSRLVKCVPTTEQEARNKEMSLSFLVSLDRLTVVQLAYHWFFTSQKKGLDCNYDRTYSSAAD